MHKADVSPVMPSTSMRFFFYFYRVSEKGVVLELMNNWTEINFCLPIKAHNLPFESELRITVTKPGFDHILWRQPLLPLAYIILCLLLIFVGS